MPCVWTEDGNADQERYRGNQDAGLLQEMQAGEHRRHKKWKLKLIIRAGRIDAEPITFLGMKLSTLFSINTEREGNQYERKKGKSAGEASEACRRP